MEGPWSTPCTGEKTELNKPDAPARADGYRFTIIAAASLGLVWLGDALIYVVLPLYPATFGIDIAMVGVLLAVNRVIRILGYGWRR